MLSELAPQVYLQTYPLRLAGCAMGRNVTVLRLSGGKLLIHSSAPFSENAREEILRLGEPGWLLEATHFHDTYARQGRQAFPEIPFWVPSGFPGMESLQARPLGDAPQAWREEITLFPLAGMPRVHEHLVFHRPSGTLIVADLFFNLPDDSGWWTKAFLRGAAGIRTFPGMSRFFRFMIKDKSAFRASLQPLGGLDIQRIVVGHGAPLTQNAKRQFLDLMHLHGFSIEEKA